LHALQQKIHPAVVARASLVGFVPSNWLGYRLVSAAVQYHVTGFELLVICLCLIFITQKTWSLCSGFSECDNSNFHKVTEFDDDHKSH